MCVCMCLYLYVCFIGVLKSRPFFLELFTSAQGILQGRLVIITVDFKRYL